MEIQKGELLIFMITDEPIFKNHYFPPLALSDWRITLYLTNYLPMAKWKNYLISKLSKDKKLEKDKQWLKELKLFSDLIELRRFKNRAKRILAIQEARMRTF